MLQVKGGMTLPGWRDFERAVALAFSGEAQESKAIFDVLLLSSNNPSLRYGLSCKMRRELNKIDRTGRVSLELSNSARQFWDYLKSKGIDHSNYRSRPSEVGASLVEVVERWHQAVNVEQGGVVDLTKSSYLVLSWSRLGLYQLHQFPLAMPNPHDLSWQFPPKRGGGEGRRLVGQDGSGSLLEWYGESGGQLKYYPLVSSAIWESEIFRLEPLADIEYGILRKVAAYFPEEWADANRE